MTGNERKSALSYTQPPAEEGYQFPVRLAFNRRRRYFYLPDPVNDVGYLVSGGIGINLK